MSNLHTALSAATEALHDPNSQKTAGDITIGLGAVTSQFWLGGINPESLANGVLLYGGAALTLWRLFDYARSKFVARRRSDDVED
ncbi:hypothetical protein [Azospirillum sp. SYSU D00513]|uniref:hypothetical protein n=1 Tax=Azospirillum sp. SYSU D00513 TaxID=2812561 RepID=UPI001A979823|nr:hypothetical protein [Azospirillum sp. SYSU D00513]